MKRTRVLIASTVIACAGAGAVGAAMLFPVNIDNLLDSPSGAVILAASAPRTAPSHAPEANAWLDQFAQTGVEAEIVLAAEEPTRPAVSVMMPKAVAEVDLRVQVPATVPALRLVAATLGSPVDDFSTASRGRLPLDVEKRENVEIHNASLSGDPIPSAMATEPAKVAEEIALLAASEITATEMPAASSVATASGPEGDDFNPFGGFGLTADPAGAMLAAYADERQAIERPGMEVEDAAYVAPFAQAQGAGLAITGKDIDLAVLATMTPEQIEASIALVAAISNPDQAQTYLDRLQGTRVADPAPAPAPMPALTGIPGLNDALTEPRQLEPVEDVGNLLTRGWEAIDTYGVVSLRRDGDASTDLVVEEGMVLGALGPIVSVRRTPTSLIVETAKAGEITGTPDFRPRPRPEWMDRPN